MFWQEDTNSQRISVSDKVLDISYSISCRRLPVDHSYALSSSLKQALPWLQREPLAAIHPIHVAGSQNGWIRPEHSPDELIHLSRRTRLVLRLPGHRIKDAEKLVGTELKIAGHPLTVGKAQKRLLSKLNTLFTRHLVCDPEQAEEDLLCQIADELKALDINIRKALCGKSVQLHTPDGPLFTRSLLLADLPADESLHLQQQGLGRHRLMGCGIFIPHKGIEAVNKTVDDANEEAG